MLYSSEELELRAVEDAAAMLCAAARTAPKARGIDHIVTCVLTGEEKDQLADAMDQLSDEFSAESFARDADNVRSAQALMLIGAREEKRGLGDICRYCHFENCADCKHRGGSCAFDGIDLGIAVGSVCALAAQLHIDNRVFFSAGRAAQELGIMGEGVGMIHGIPLSVSGKSPFFDRKKKA